jgi:hypothetical protein
MIGTLVSCFDFLEDFMSYNPYIAIIQFLVFIARLGELNPGTRTFQGDPQEENHSQRLSEGVVNLKRKIGPGRGVGIEREVEFGR